MTTHGTMPQPYDPVQLRFPFSDVTGTKLRPVLVRTPANSQGDLIDARITARLHHVPQVRLADSDFELGGLPKARILGPDKVLTLNNHLVARRPGRLNRASFSHTLGTVCKYLGCPHSAASDIGGQ